MLACSDSHTSQKEPWSDRKTQYLAAIIDKSDGAVLVTACDKLHNATSILTALRDEGPSVFDRFTARRHGTLRYYRALSDALAQRLPGRLGDRLDDVVRQIEAIASLDGHDHKLGAPDLLQRPVGNVSR